MKKIVSYLAAAQPILLSALALLYVRLIVLLTIDLYEHSEVGAGEQFILFAVLLVLVLLLVVYAVRASGRLLESFAARTTALLCALANLSFGSAFYVHSEALHELVPLPLSVAPYLYIALACVGFVGVLCAAAVFSHPKLAEPAV